MAIPGPRCEIADNFQQGGGGGQLQLQAATPPLVQGESEKCISAGPGNPLVDKSYGISFQAGYLIAVGPHYT